MSSGNNKADVLDVLAPAPGESVSEVQIGQWLVSDGQFVDKNQPILDIESEKASLQIVAEKSGTITLKAKAGETVATGTKIATISPGQKTSQPAAPTLDKPDKKSSQESANKPDSGKTLSIAAAKMMAEHNINEDQITPSGKDGVITKADVIKASLSKIDTPISPSSTGVTLINKAIAEEVNAASDSQFLDIKRHEEKIPMSQLRKKIAQRLVAVKNQTAMLTTFNEIDLNEVMNVRKKYKEVFKEKHNIGLGFMSFFAKACSSALMEFPMINSRIEDDNIIVNHYVDLGIAVSAPKGLMVPIIRNAEHLTMAQIEQKIVTLADKARNNKITMDDMNGGTFTITNGGVFGSLLSTPIINPPQSAILGMHKIAERPVVIDKQIVIRPIMYVALSYDHRIVDGKESVTFLSRVKELLEDPIRLLLNT